MDAGAGEGGGSVGWTVEIRWKGPKIALGALRRREKKESRREREMGGNGVVWDEEFVSVCSLTGNKEGVFYPWEIGVTVFNNGLNHGQKGKTPVVGTASINLAEFASKGNVKDFELSIPLTSTSSTEPHPLLYISLSVMELRAAQESADSTHNKFTVLSASPSPPPSVDALSSDKEDLSALKAGLRKVKILTEYVSIRRTKKPFREEEDSESTDYAYPFDSDSIGDDLEEEQSDDLKVEGQSGMRKSFSYGSLAHANFAGSSFYSNVGINEEDEDWVYYSHRKSDVGCSKMDDFTALTSEPPLVFPPKRSILPWKKRKISFKSPKAKGKPLLNKANVEEGGDDIDFDRRQLSSDESLGFGSGKADEESNLNQILVSEFGDDNFAVGSWEHKEVTSRDGHMKLQTEVFFASIDQRSERAAGESACTALVAVIANWFQNNCDQMPIKSQFDTLIREGSLEWRNLCDIETYRKRFPDKHFDLETVLEAGIRPLLVVPEKSFIGFFHPEGMDESSLDFLHGAMSFDSIWDEVSRLGPDCSPRVYIVSWNDHFFVLLVESQAYYIIDTLGERLHEGCDQAYILKFDTSTTISKVPNAVKSSEVIPVEKEGLMEDKVADEQEEIFCQGKESCKEYIKSFLAAIPIRELLADMKKGLVASMPLHHRLQIEFHYTRLLTPEHKFSAIEADPREQGQIVGAAVTDV